MAFSIKNEEADRLARELTELTGESLTDAVLMALRERLERKRVHPPGRPLHERLAKIGRRFRRRPRLDRRSADEILGYDRDGLPS